MSTSTQRIRLSHFSIATIACRAYECTASHPIIDLRRMRTRSATIDIAIPGVGETSMCGRRPTQSIEFWWSIEWKTIYTTSSRRTMGSTFGRYDVRSRIIVFGMQRCWGRCWLRLTSYSFVASGVGTSIGFGTSIDLKPELKSLTSR